MALLFPRTMKDPNPAISIPHRVLIIDDNVDGTRMLSLILQAWGCATREAHSGEDGLRIGEEFGPTLVLLDLGMPHMDGHETCRRMRQLAWGAQMRIMAFTGSSLESEYARAKEAGFDGYLLKPIGKDVLKELLAGHMTTEWTERPQWLDKE
jgi:CheY-like chemotaxis protein